MSSSIRFKTVIAGEKPSAQLFKLAVLISSMAAAGCFLLVLWQVISQQPLPGKPGWAEALLVITLTLATLANLSRQLPGQNVLLAAAIIGLVGGIAHGVGAVTAIPFGPFTYTDSAGPKFFNTLAWPIPALWIIIVLNSRGVARLILRPWRKLKNYGFWLIGITTALVILFDLGLEPFASQTNRYWLWLPTTFPIQWQGAPLVNSLGWLLATLLMLAFATPPLINKQSRSRKTVPDYHPLIVWLLGLALFAASAGVHRLWLVVGFCVVAGAITTLAALRGARW
ncbi:MAG TPA: carotenoid biosynthesis protein [Verrucomicrobiae bacterium]|nr:carotenoid biosynthesis protein [Verrucomicrobiae bacterium]